MSVDNGRIAELSSGNRESRLGRFWHFDIPLPALIFELDVLNRDRVRIGVKIGQGLVFRNPASKYLVSEGELPGFVIDL